MLMSDVATEYAVTDIGVLGQERLGPIEHSFQELEGQARQDLLRQEVPQGDHRFERSMDLRYLGQEHVLEIPVGALRSVDDIRRGFESIHSYRYGHTTSDEIQVVNLRVRGIGEVEKPTLSKLPRTQHNGDPSPAGSRKAYCFAARGVVDFELWHRKDLTPDMRIAGPAIVDEGTSTTVFFSDQQLEVDDFGHMIIRSTR